MNLPPTAREFHAYCVATLDVSVDPPVIAHVSIYSSSAIMLTTMSKRYCNVDVLMAYGESYHEAREQLLKTLAGSALHQWAFRWIKEERQHR